MGLPILIVGESGSGKTASLRNFNADEIGIFNVASKPLPFKKKFKTINKATYEIIEAGINSGKYKTYIIDDSQYLMSFEALRRAKETGYTKHTEIGQNFYNLIEGIINAPDDVIVYLLHHSETDENNKRKAKTIGKMLDSQLTVEGVFSIVLFSESENGEYKFVTQSDGYTTAKSPMEMFEKEIGNDLKIVDDTVREYWGLPKRENTSKPTAEPKKQK